MHKILTNAKRFLLISLPAAVLGMALRVATGGTEHAHAAGSIVD